MRISLPANPVLQKWTRVNSAAKSARVCVVGHNSCLFKFTFGLRRVAFRELHCLPSLLVNLPRKSLRASMLAARRSKTSNVYLFLHANWWLTLRSSKDYAYRRGLSVTKCAEPAGRTSGKNRRCWNELVSDYDNAVYWLDTFNNWNCKLYC